MTVLHPLVINSSVNNNYNEGIRITRAGNSWAGITFGSTGTEGAPSGGWFVATNPSNQFIINPDNSGNTAGLCCNKGGDLKWRNNTVIHSGNISSQSVNYATSAGSASSVAWSNVSSKPSSYTPSSHNHDYDSYIGTKSKYTQKSARGSNPHHLIYGSDADYGVMKVQHTSDEGSGGPGAFTASLAIFDERANNLSGTYQPTFYINRSGATRTPDLLGIDIGGTRVLTVNSSGVTSGTFSGNLSGNASSASSVSWTNISGGRAYLPENTAHYFRDPNNASWRGGMYWGNAGNESMTFAVTHANTRFQFITGSDITGYSSSTWSSLNPDLTIQGGNITVKGSAYANSDRHIKKDIKDIPRSSLEELYSMLDKLFKQYTYKSSGKASYGFIAQQLEKYVPEAVTSDEASGIKSVSYDVAYAKIIAALVYRVKALEELVSSRAS